MVIYDQINLIFMHIVLNKVLTGIVVWQLSDVILYALFTNSCICRKGYEEMFFGRLYIICTVIFQFTLVAHVTRSHIHSHMPSFKTVPDAQTNITLRTKIQCAPSFVLHFTHTAMTLVSF